MPKLGFKLYHYPLSRSVRVKWLLHEICGDAFDVEVVKLLKGVQYTPEFLAMNPNHAVPVLEVTGEDGASFTMVESGAMIAFLADVYPGRALAPSPTDRTAARADYLQMLHFGTSSMDMMLWQVRLHRDLLPRAERDPATEQRYLQKFRGEVEPQLRARLENTAFVCGDDFLAVDCVMGQNINWARAYGLCQDPAFDTYLERLKGRPAYQAAYADRALFGAD